MSDTVAPGKASLPLSIPPLGYTTLTLRPADGPARLGANAGLVRSERAMENEFLAVKEAYGDKRKSVIKAAEEVEFTQEDFIVHEDVTVILTKMGWIRRAKTVGENLRFKEGDSLLALIPANTKDNVAIFSSAGKVYVIKAYDLPAGSGFGDPVQHLFKFGDGERPVTAMNLTTLFSGAAAAPLVEEEQKGKKKGKKKDKKKEK